MAYQIYTRSFADASGDGVGDLAGVTSRLPALVELGVDAIWLSPFFRSPQKDGGYDVSNYRDVDPVFGTLTEFDGMLHVAHDLGLRVIIDIVPNHTSDQHEWFGAALAAPAGSPERERYIFRDGRGVNGDEPPNNWQSVFGGPMWTRDTRPDGTGGQWYLHIFDPSQPDLNWENPEVRSEFRDVLRFWLDRGVDGFRVDVAHGLVKAPGLPDDTTTDDGGSMGGGAEPPPYWGQEGVHDIWREWRSVLDEYEGDRILCAEAWVTPLSRAALWVRPDEMHHAFNFSYLSTGWNARALRSVINESIEAFTAVGAHSTWVLSNHDVIRHASRLALAADIPQGVGIGPNSPDKPDAALGLRRARAASALMLALPGSAYLFQGEELGLPEYVDLPDEARQDPTWLRTNGQKYGRDGCRVPLPWEADAPAFGFSSTGESWLPQPTEWASFARDTQRGVSGSTFELYRTALGLRREYALGSADLHWIDGFGDDVLAFRCGDVVVIANTGESDVRLDERFSSGATLLETTPSSTGVIPPDSTVWLTSVAKDTNSN